MDVKKQKVIKIEDDNLLNNTNYSKNFYYKTSLNML